MAGGLNPDFSTMLTFDECVNIFDQWLEKEHGGVPNSLKIKTRSGAKHTVEWRSGTSKYNGYITDNIVDFGYSNPVGIFYKGSTPHKTNVMGAIVDLEGGKDGPMMQSIKERYAERKSIEEAKHNKLPEQSAEEKAQKEAARKARELESNRLDLINRLPGAFVAQYAYLASVQHADPAYHQGQKVQSVEQQPYIKKKGFEINQAADDFYILSKHVPTNEQLEAFIKSDVCKLPRNELGVTKEDVLQKIKDPEFGFSYNKYLTKHNIDSGIGIIPSRDPDGVVTNLQRFLNEPLVNDGKKVDKIFLPEAIVVGSAYVFNHQEKLNESYKPKNIIINEGWATGRTVNEAVDNDKDTMVIVAWNAGQVKNIAETYLKLHPEANLTIAADNDCKSFYYMNEKETAQDLLKVKNTGLQVALETYAAFPEEQHRIGIILPRINYEKYNAQKGLSDFNDIHLHYGINAAHDELNGELERLRVRKEAGISEAPRIVKMYNAQAQFYSNLYNVEVRGLEADGSLNNLMIKPVENAPPSNNQSLEQKTDSQPVTDKKETSINAVNNDSSFNNDDDDNELLMPHLQSDVSGFFNQPINNSLKTDFDKRYEESIGSVFSGSRSASEVLAQDANKEPTPKDMVVFASNEKAPDVQPMINPADFTLMLYQRGLMEQYTEVITQPTKDKMMESLQNNVYSMGGLVRTINILLDDTMRPHVTKSIDKVLDGYQDKPFYQDLVQIKSFANEQFIQKNLVDQEALKSFHKDMVTTLLKGVHAEHGFDRDVVAKMSESAISRKPVEEKREFYRQFVDSLKNLNEDSTWVKQVSQTLEGAYKMAQHKASDNEVKHEQSNTLQPDANKKKNDLSFD